MLNDKAQLLKLTAREMMMLIGGLRVLDVNYGHTPYGVLAHHPETLTNDFLPIYSIWKPSGNHLEKKKIYT